MKYNASTLALLAVCALGVGNGLGAEPPSPKPPRLEISLWDGSLLLGETSLASISLVSEGMGQMDVQLGFIGGISFSADHESDSVKFSNGDTIRGSVTGVKEISLKTLFGPVSVPLNVIRELRVHPDGTGRVVDWEVLPFPRDSNWPATRGEPAKVDADEIVLKGQPVRTQQSFSAPMSFGCEVTLEQLTSDDGCLWIEFVADGADPEPNVPPQSASLQLGYHQRGPGGGMFTIAGAGSPPADLVKDPFEFEAGKPCRLEIGVTPDGEIRATLNGQVFETRVTIPFKTFHIELMGWQPTNTWHVRDFLFH